MITSNAVLRAALALALAGSLSACSFVESLFPDKQKQYRYSSDIPPLEIPPDLTSSTLEGVKGAGGSGPSSRDEVAEENTPPDAVEEAPAPRRTAATKSAAKSEVPRTTLAQSDDNATLIEMEAPFAETWNDVSRALGRLEVELTDQNRSDGTFYVYYGGATPKSKEDEGIWDGITSMFSGGEKASEYHVKLEEAGNVTNIFVLDASGKSVSDGPGYELLKRLNETLRTLDQPESEAEGRKDKGE